MYIGKYVCIYYTYNTSQQELIRHISVTVGYNIPITIYIGIGN